MHIRWEKPQFQGHNRVIAHVAGFEVEVYLTVNKIFHSQEMPNLQVQHWYFSLCWGTPEELARQKSEHCKFDKPIQFGSQFVGALSEGLTSQEAAQQAAEFAVGYLSDRKFLQAPDVAREKLLNALADRLVSTCNGR